ncbi:MAG: transketolase-like TK C-terminal-containing protein, partial [Acidobacteriota bacterium]
QDLLAAEGIGVSVVSMPSWELFEKQSREYRDEVLPPHVSARLAIEAGISFGWSRYVGDKGAVIALDRFGASAPYQVLMEKFGFTAANASAKVKQMVR